MGTGGCLHHQCFTVLFLAASNPALCISKQRTKGNGEQQLLKFGVAPYAGGEGPGQSSSHSNTPLLVPSPPTVTPMVKSSFPYHEALRAELLGAKTPWTVSKGPELACLDMILPFMGLHVHWHYPHQPPEAALVYYVPIRIQLGYLDSPSGHFHLDLPTYF